MNGTLQNLLEAARVSRVVWIDDLFGKTRPAEQADTALNTAVGYLHSTKKPLAHVAFDGLSGDEPVDVWQTAVEAYVANHPDDRDFVAAVLSAGGEDQIPGEYLSDSLEVIVAALGEKVLRLDLETWQQKRTELIAAAVSSLFLVDREFKSGLEKTNDGERILAELVREAPRATVVMLTHSVTPDNADAVRVSIASEHGISPNAFALFPKAQARDDASAAERALRGSLRGVFTYRTCETLAQTVADLFEKAMRESVNDLRQQSVYDLDRAVFENSLEEGASELDVLIRILQVRQRVRAQAGLLDEREAVNEVLGRLHAIRGVTADAPLVPELSAKASLMEWRRDEVYDKGGYVNAFNAPLACGDLFAKTEGGVPAFVLLEQPCDLVVRANEGSRKACEGVLVAVLAKAPARESQYGIPAWEGVGQHSLEFLSWCSVRLDYLELACYNSNGHVALDPDAPAPKWLLPGWKKSHAKRCNEVREGAADKAKPSRFGLLTLSTKVRVGSGKLEGKKLSFPLFRVGRLRAPRAATALAAFAAHRTRAAFDHDFAHGLRVAEAAAADSGPDALCDSSGLDGKGAANE